MPPVTTVAPTSDRHTEFEVFSDAQWNPWPVTLKPDFVGAREYFKARD